MELPDIQRMIQSKRLVFRNDQKFWHYSVVPFALIVPVWNLFHLDDFPVEISLFFLAVAIGLFVLQYRAMSVRKLCSPVEPELFKKAIRLTAADLEWRLGYCDDSFVRAESVGLGPWTEMITIIRDDSGVYFSSICSPDSKPAVFSFVNRVNRKQFVKNLIKLSEEE